MFLSILVETGNLHHWLELDSFFTISVNVFKTFLAISIFLLGIYFRKSIFINKNNIIKPNWVSWFGILFMLLLFIPSISSFFILRSINLNTYAATNEMIEKWKIQALSNECESNNNRFFAKMYFTETGEITQYLNENGDIVNFAPTKEESEQREEELSQEEILRHTVKASNNIFYSKILVVVSTILIWLSLLNFLPPEKIIIKS